MGLLIDSNIFIASERSRSPEKLAELLNQIPAEHHNDEALISAITASELELGIHRADTDQRRERRRAFVEAVLDQFSTATIDLRVARSHARLVAKLMADGEIIGIHDSWIAATAVAHGHAIVTANHREFIRVSGLSVIPINLQST